jgi:hypothetical protein
MSGKRISRQKEYALMEESGRRRTQTRRHADYFYDEDYSQYSKPLDKNTLAPPEDVLDARRHTPRNINMQHVSGQSRSALTENLILLALLVGSIYGLYRLSIYLLNQA